MMTPQQMGVTIVSLALIVLSFKLFEYWCPPEHTTHVCSPDIRRGLAELATVAAENIELRRGPILGTVQEDGRMLQLHSQVAVVRNGRGPSSLLMERRYRPGSTLVLIEPA